MIIPWCMGLNGLRRRNLYAFEECADVRLAQVRARKKLRDVCWF